METEKLTNRPLNQMVGKDIGVTDWISIDQDRIQMFATCTDDHQWIHVDQARASEESPHRKTIAHGFLTLSLLTRFHMNLGVYPEYAKQVINYGLNKVRFLNPVKEGDEIRNRVLVDAVEAKANDAHLITLRNTIEIKGNEKPAMVAEMLVLITK